jgi:hypothetical protein
LNDRHGPAALVRHALSRASLPLQEAEHGAHEHADHGTAQRVIPGQHVPNLVRQAEHPLAHRDGRKHVIHQMRGALRHATPTAARTHCPALARKRNQAIQAATVTPKPGKAAGQ